MINQLHILFITAFLMDLSVSGVSFALTRRAAELHASSWVVGLLGSVMFASYTLFALLLGRVSDRTGRRPIAATGAFLAALTGLACAFTTNIPVLLGLSLLFGAGIGGFWPTIMGWLGENAEGAALSKRLAQFSMSWNTGLVVGFALTGLLFKQSPQLAFYFAGGGIALVTLLLLLRVPPIPKESLPSILPVIPAGRGFRKTSWLANFALTFSMAGAIALFPTLATALHIAADKHGLLLAFGRGAALLAFWLLQHLQFWRTRLWPLWVAQGIVVLALLSIGLTDGFWIYALCLAAIGAVSSYTYQASIYFTLEESVEKGKGSGFHEAVLASGMFLGPLLAGAVGEHYSLRSPYFFCAAVLALMIAVQMTVVRWRRSQ